MHKNGRNIAKIIKQKMEVKKVIVSGGGTAGHIYPALAVADCLSKSGVEVLFVGATGKMEMERVPANGYKIIGLPITGIQRRLTLKNLAVPFKMLKSTAMAKKIIRDFAPDVVAGFGGYASAPILRAAQKAGVKTVIQEQNSYAGLTNKMLAKKADAICTAYAGMERFFDKAKITLTGNPLRGNITQLPQRSDAIKFFGLDPRRNTILVTGGSLGTRTLNEMVINVLQSANRGDVQIIWQTGKFYQDEMEQRAANIKATIPYIKMAFIERMDMAYAAADVVICRAGASTVSELQLIGVPAVFVPSPNVAEDHQTANARALVEGNAARMIPDSQAVAKCFGAAMEMLGNPTMLAEISRNLKFMGKPNAAADVADIITGTAKKVYFIGIGGIGMSALARFFAHQGYAVAGYDRVSTPLTAALEKEGIKIHYEDNVEMINKSFLNKSTTVIYTPAVPNDHSELTYFKTHGYDIKKRSAALGLLCKDKYVMAVAGTHGKSTTSTLVAWLNHCAGGGGSAFLGAISKNFHSNMVLGAGDRMAVEADEFDRSFHQLFPSVALVTAADADHLDIYGNAENFKAAFVQFLSQVQLCKIVKLGIDLPHDYTYSLSDSAADYYAKNITLLNGGHYQFDIVTPTTTIEKCVLGIPGLINVENAVGAVAIVAQAGYDEAKLKDGLATFEGIERRFDFWINEPSKVYMDDYAHHPNELLSMLTSVRDMFPNRHITICFQPHLYTRTRDFAAEFATALSIANRVILIPIYPAREEPIEGVTSDIIYKGITCEKRIVQKSELARTLAEIQTDVVITAGAGDIDALRAEIYEVLKAK